MEHQKIEGYILNTDKNKHCENGHTPKIALQMEQHSNENTTELQRTFPKLI